MKKSLLMKKLKNLNVKATISLIAIIMLSTVFVNVQAQVVHSSGLIEDSTGFALDDYHVFYAKITPLDTAETNLIDCSFTLSETSIVEWGDYSVAVRWRNDIHSYIDARNDGDFAVNDEMEIFFDKAYDVWIEVDVFSSFYSVFIDTTGGEAPVEVAFDYEFRKSPVSELAYWSVISQPGNKLEVSSIGAVEQVGEFPTVVSAKKFSTKPFNVYPNPFTEYVQVDLDGKFSYQVFDIGGMLISKGEADSSTKIGKNLDKGSYIMNLKNKEAVYNVKLLKQ